MDAKVRELFQKVKESAMGAGRTAGKAAGELVNQAKLNIRIVELNSEIEAAYKNLGKMLYAVHNGVEIPADSIDENLLEIDGKKAEIDELRVAIQKAKAPFICPVCGKYIGRRAKFCSSCGAHIEREDEYDEEEYYEYEAQAPSDETEACPETEPCCDAEPCCEAEPCTETEACSEGEPCCDACEGEKE